MSDGSTGVGVGVGVIGVGVGVGADLGRVGGRGSGLKSDPAFAHHHDPIREFQNFIQIFADQQHGNPLVAGLQYPAPDRGHGGEIQSETGVGNDQ